MSQDRRSFFRSMGAATVVAAGLTSVEPLQRTAEAAAVSAVTPVLELGGAVAGRLQDATGGFASASVVETVGTGGVMRKRLVDVSYQDISLTCGLGMTDAFYQWIDDTLGGQHQPRDGAVVTGSNLTWVRQEFLHALVSKVVFPGVETTSRAPVFFEVSLTAERTRRLPGVAPVVQSVPGKRWLARNFELQIAGLDMTHVDQIEPITAEAIFEDPIGSTRPTTPSVLAMNPGNVMIRIPQSQAQTLVDWHHTFVELGQNTSSQVKAGTLKYLAADLRSTLCTLHLFNLGIFALTEDVTSRNRWFRAEMYCERLGLEVGS